VGGKKGAGAGKVKVKGPPLVYPASRPIITCAAIEQVCGYGGCCCCRVVLQYALSVALAVLVILRSG
jgi:hypothetical protein